MMIVQCQACQTRFRVDESRIQGRGARMRCRRCGEAILVMKESASRPGPPSPKNLFDLRSVLRQPERKPPRESGETEAEAPQTTSVAPPRKPEAPVAWEPTPPEPPEPATGEEAPEVASPDEAVSLRIPEPPAAEEEAPETGPEPEPEAPREPEAPAAWEPTPPEPSEPATREEAPEVASPDEAVSLRIPEPPAAEEDAPETGPESEPEAPREPEAAEPPFPGPEPEPEAPREPDAPAAWEPTPPEPSEPATGEEAPQVASPDEAEIPQEPGSTNAWEPSTAEPPVPTREDKPSGKADEEKPFELLLNNADSLDFLKGDFPRTDTNGELDISGLLRSDPAPDPEPVEIRLPTVPPASASPDEPMPDRLEAIQRELQEIGGGSPDPGPIAAPPLAAEAPAVPPVRKAPPLVPKMAARPGKLSGGRPSLVPLAILFFLIAGGGAYLGFTPGGQKLLRRAVPAMESLWLGKETAKSRYAVGNLVGYYEQNTRAGTLFVIKGTVTNRGRKKRSGIRVHAELFGTGGTLIAGKTVFAGNAFSAESIRSSSRDAIEKGLSNRWGDKLSNLDVASGKSIPFLVVFFDAPAGIEEYRLEALDSE